MGLHDLSAGQPPLQSAHSSPVLTIQTPQNTVDVRGQDADEAVSQVVAGLSSVPPNSALFVVHGVGSGQLRTQIHRFLQHSSQVSKFNMEKDSAGGCTVVFLK